MHALVVYDSQWGNTEAIARAIGGSLGPDVRIKRATEWSNADLEGCELLVIGSPTQGGRPLSPITTLIAGLPGNALADARVAAFDTRLASSERGFALRLLMRAIGFAAPKIAKAMQSKGGRLALPPEGFLVEDKEGPLKPGERERAAAWAATLREAAAT